MIRIKHTLAKLAVLALALPISATAFAASDSQEKLPEKACEVHKPVTGDCHVHDTNTYQHMRMQDRGNMGPHGRREMSEARRKEEQKIRN
tara:strand:- start:526 stop:795 length:270 start_codon:yes stop_codon:yes gene_type:complete